MAIPLAGVLASLLVPRAEIRSHLARTQLVELMANPALLLLGVGVGTLALGTGLAWLVVAFRRHAASPGGWRAWAATAACTAVLGLAFVGPLGRLVLWAVATATASGALAGFPALVGNTVWLAGLAAAATTVLALALAYAARLRPTSGVRLAVQFSGMGYALPGAVIAVGVLGPVALPRSRPRRRGRGGPGAAGGAALTGSAAALLFAYVVRFLAVGAADRRRRPPRGSWRASTTPRGRWARAVWPVACRFPSCGAACSRPRFWSSWKR